MLNLCKLFFVALTHIWVGYCERAPFEASLPEQISGCLNTCLGKWAPQRPFHLPTQTACNMSKQLHWI